MPSTWSALDHRQDTYISETAIHTSQRYFKCSKLYINAVNTSLQMMHLLIQINKLQMEI